MKTDLSTKKKGDKYGIIWPNGTGGIKMIIILLAKVVVFHI